MKLIVKFKNIFTLGVLLFVCAFSVSVAHAEVATSTKEQKIEVLSPSGKGGEEFFKRGEKIPYSYTLKKNSKKLAVRLYGGPKGETVYEAKKYDGWGTNTKVISARNTAKLAPGSYGLVICDYTESNTDPVCDGSDGVITITDDDALDVAPREEKEQKIEIKSPNGGEQFYKGESINYNYKLAKNTKNLLVELVDADQNTVEYSVKRYDGWGDNRKIISKDATKKIPGGMYILRICDTSTRVPVCDVSDGRITIVDKLPTSQIIAPVLTKVESKAADPNELFAGESAVVYGTNIDKYTQVYIVNEIQNKYFKTKYTQSGSITINTFVKGELIDGSYKLYAVNGNSISNALTVTYKNPKKEEVSDEGKMNGSCILVRNLTLGSRGEDVSFLQAFLKKKNISAVINEETGYFGPATKAAVIEYQTSLNMAQPNGFVGALTLAKINAECNSNSNNTDPQEQEDNDPQQSSETADPQKRISGAPTDACRNIPGDQASIPQGYTNTGVKVSGNCKKIGAKDEDSEPIKEERKNQEQKIEKICQILQTKVTNGRVQTKETEWKTVKCNGDAFQNAKSTDRRTQTKNIEKGTQSSSEISYPAMIELESGATHDFVKTIQKYLNSNGYMVNEKEGEPGSKGYESDYFGEKTKQALIKFQKDKGISPAHGYFGPKTRAAMGI
ncbi:MAG: trimeric autotransporter adhesin [Candidatus Parcubacteria bacterium]|jgi:peptidoglycan hydrolase-like protein with peptidoglycan-binding domain/CDGSH-type Zn-finger protein